ncbi:unnamed protein product, partial [Meganyctiphanes norvegica]
RENGWQEILVSGKEPQIGWIFNSATHNFVPPKEHVQFPSRDLIFFQIECESKKQICTELRSNVVPYSNYPWYEDYKKSQAKDIIYVRTTKVKEKKVSNDFECQARQAVVTSLCYKASVDILLHFDRRVSDAMAKELYIYLSNVLNGSKVDFFPPFIDRTVKVVNVYCKGNRRKYDNKSLFGLKEACRILQEHECKLLTSVKVVNHLYPKRSDIICVPSKKYIPSIFSFKMNLPSMNMRVNRSKLISDRKKLSASVTLHKGSGIMNDGEYIKSKEYSVSDAFKLRSLGRAKLLSGLNNKYPTTAKKHYHISKKESVNTENSNIHRTKKNQDSSITRDKKNSNKNITDCQQMTSEFDDDVLNKNQIDNHKGLYHKDKNINKKNESIEKYNHLCNMDKMSKSSSKGRRSNVSDRIVESVANMNAKIKNNDFRVDYSLTLTPENSQFDVIPPLVNGINGLQQGAYLRIIFEDVMKKLEEEIFYFTTVSSMHNSKTISKNIWELASIANYHVNCIQHTQSTIDDILIQVVYNVCQKNYIDPNDCLKRLSFCSTQPLINAIEGTFVGLNEIYIHAKQTAGEESITEAKIIKKGEKDINNNNLEEIEGFILLLCNWCNKIHKLERMSYKIDINITDQDLVLRCTECGCEGWKHRNLKEDCDDVSFRVSPKRILQYTKRKLEKILVKHVVFGMKLDLCQALLFFLEGNKDNGFKEFIMDLFNLINKSPSLI